MSYCRRPGWWTPEEVIAAIAAGFAERMMLEFFPTEAFAVVAPAFQGAECSFAMEHHSKNPCTFFKNNLCELHGTGLQPLECRACHHRRPKVGAKCHADIAKAWKSVEGQEVVRKWTTTVRFFEKIGEGR